MNVTMWERCIFECGKVYCSNSIIIFNFVQTLILNCWLKMYSLPTLTLQSPNKMFMYYLWNLSNIHSISLEKLSFISPILSSFGVWIFRTMISHQRRQKIIYDILSLTNSTLLTADMILLCTQRCLYLIHEFHSPLHRKIYFYILQLVRCHLSPMWPTVLSLNLIYF
jgi:hypothetical protein